MARSIDPKITSYYPDKQNSIPTGTEKNIMLVLKIAVWCLIPPSPDI